MNEMSVISVIIFLFSTYHLCMELRITDSTHRPKQDIWMVYVCSMLLLVTANFLYYSI
ncbi:hypothetical protein SAMN05421787_101785 [Virgibacillus pantothenticus]|nr:hypothetical protein SAMN05421787_101785 [Virgibacillus pantothenticus]